MQRLTGCFALCLAALLNLWTGAAGGQQRPEEWLTTGDGKHLLEKQKPLQWHTTMATDNAIMVDETHRYQTMDGFGHALTGGSAELLMKMSPQARSRLLHELFGTSTHQTGVSYLRVTIGASDMNDRVYTYDDLPTGGTDPRLEHFTLAEDEKDVIPVLKEILAISPHLSILASPWTAPAWMKDNGSVKGGSLLKQYYATYAEYLVRYIQGMQANGIGIAALTPQNEPENPHNTPSMIMTANQEADFIGHDLGPALKRANLTTKIIAYDHNCDHPEYPETVLRDANAALYTAGSGFHLYLGHIDALTQVHDAFPNKSIYFTEQMVIAEKNDPFPIASSVARLIIGAPENWSRNVLLWNLAADAQNGPHTSDGGCPICTGALTIEGDQVTRRVAYYAIAQASEFVAPGSVRIASGGADVPPHVAFLRPDGKHVLIVANPSLGTRVFFIGFKGRSASTRLDPGAAATYVW